MLIVVESAELQESIYPLFSLQIMDSGKARALVEWVSIELDGILQNKAILLEICQEKLPKSSKMADHIGLNVQVHLTACTLPLGPGIF